MMKLVWSEPALADRKAIFDYIEASDPQAASRMDTLFQEKAERLFRFPHMGRPGRVSRTRELVAHPNYVLHYDIVGDTIRVVAILHTSQMWPPPQSPV